MNVFHGRVRRLMSHTALSPKGNTTRYGRHPRRLESTARMIERREVVYVTARYATQKQVSKGRADRSNRRNI